MKTAETFPQHEVRASAPGNLMLMGEHAVLFGHRALAAAVDLRLTISAKPRQDRQIRIFSDLGRFEADLDQMLPACPEMKFIHQGLLNFQSQLKTGFDWHIEMAFSSTVGLGSSAAVTIASVALLHYFSGKTFDRRAIFDDAYLIVQQVQGRGSGTDLAASAYGGIIGYTRPTENAPAQISPISGILPEIQLFYCGYKTPTPEVIRLVAEKAAVNPKKFTQIYRDMGRFSVISEKALADRNLTAFKTAMNAYHSLMVELGVSDSAIDAIISQAMQNPDAGAKISGSGLGDCVITLDGAEIHGYLQIPIKLSPTGVTLESL